MAFKTLPPEGEIVERHARKCLAFAQATKSWEIAANRARILRGRPLPGSLRPKAPLPKRRQRVVELRASAACLGLERSAAPPSELPAEAARSNPPATVGGCGASRPTSPATTATAPHDEPCLVCGGRGKRRESNFGIDVACTACKGTGRQLASHV